MLPFNELKAYLESPVRLSPKELQRRAMDYIGSLSSEQCKVLRAEAPEARFSYAEAIEFLRRADFTALEASWYANVGLDDFRVRRLVARRALVARRLGGSRVWTAYNLIDQEANLLGDMTDDQVMEVLYGCST